MAAAEGEREHPDISSDEDWPGGDETDDEAGEPTTTDGPAAASDGTQQPAERAGGGGTPARKAARGETGGEGARAERRATPQTAEDVHKTRAEDVHMSEAGASSDAGHATPEGARADAAATPARTGGAAWLASPLAVPLMKRSEPAVKHQNQSPHAQDSCNCTSLASDRLDSSSGLCKASPNHK